MGSVAFVRRIKQGKAPEVQQLMAELAGERAEEEHERRADIGLKRIKIWHQSGPEDLFIVYYESDDPEASYRQWLEHDHEHESWLQARLDELTEPDAATASSGWSPSALIYDWHEEHGPSTREHPV